jgi:hypothetical protein
MLRDRYTWRVYVDRLATDAALRQLLDVAGAGPARSEIRFGGPQ